MRFFQKPSENEPHHTPDSPYLPAITVANVEMALLVGARTPDALARLFGVDASMTDAVKAIAHAITILMLRGFVREAAGTDRSLYLLRSERERPYDDVRRKPSPRPRPEV